MKKGSASFFSRKWFLIVGGICLLGVLVMNYLHIYSRNGTSDLNLFAELDRATEKLNTALASVETIQKWNENSVMDFALNIKELGNIVKDIKNEIDSGKTEFSTKITSFENLLWKLEQTAPTDQRSLSSSRSSHQESQGNNLEMMRLLENTLSKVNDMDESLSKLQQQQKPSPAFYEAEPEPEPSYYHLDEPSRNPQDEDKLLEYSLLPEEGMDPSLTRLNDAVKKLKNVPFHDFHEYEETNFSPTHFKRDVDVVIDILTNEINSQRIFHTRSFQEQVFLDQFPPKRESDCRMWFERALLVQHHWPSQVGQDWINFFNHAAGMEGEKGFFVEVGARHPKEISNSFFLEQCLGWEGICIDANPENARILRRDRNCIVVDNCISDKPEMMQFYPSNYKEQGKEGGGGALTSLTSSHIQRTQRHIDVQCDTLNNILQKHAPGRERINFMSIDIEGAEEMALSGLDLHKYVVDVLDIEFDKTVLGVQYFLEDHGYHKVLTSEMDFIFVKHLPPIFTPQSYVNGRIFQSTKKDGAYDFVGTAKK